MTISVAFAGVSGISSVSGTPGNAAKPLRHLRSRSMPPPLVGEALAFRRVFDDFAAAPFGFIGDEPSLPRAPLLGKTPPAGGGGTQVPKGERLASGCETERLDKGRLSSERNNAGAALYNLSVIFASLDATSPDKGRLCGGEVLSQHRVLLRNEISLSMAPLFRGAVERMRD